jgi:hypothetical protein
MGTIQIKKYERTVTIGKGNEQRQKVQKTYGKIRVPLVVCYPFFFRS